MMSHYKGLKCDGSNLIMNQIRDSKVGCLVLGKEQEGVCKYEAGT